MRYKAEYVVELESLPSEHEEALVEALELSRGQGHTIYRDHYFHDPEVVRARDFVFSNLPHDAKSCVVKRAV